jgi:hypothetical protein
VGKTANTNVLDVVGERHRISALTVSRAADPAATAEGIRCHDCRFVGLDDIHFDRHGIGLSIGTQDQTTLASQFVHVRNCWFTPRFETTGIHILSGADHRIDGCFVEPWNRGIVMSGNSNGIFITNTTVINGGKYNYGIVSEGNGFARYIIACNIENAIHQQVFVGGQCSRVTIANCWIGAGNLDGTTRTGIQIEPGADTIKLTGNRIGDQRVCGIVSRGNNVIIQGNDLAGNVNAGSDAPSILIEGGQHILVASNRVSSNAQSCGIRLRDHASGKLGFCLIHGNDLYSRKDPNNPATFNGAIQNQSTGQRIVLKDNFDTA